MEKLFTFRMISPEEESFLLEIEASSGLSFFELHKALQKLLKYKPDHPASFYLTNHKWEKEKEVTLINQDENGHGNILYMENALIKDHLNAQKNRLLYVYDFFFERSFNIELINISELKPSGSKKPPRLLKQEGKIPSQILMPEFIPGEDDLDDFLGPDIEEGPDIEPLDI